MENIQLISNLISSVGFPIVVSLIMIKMNKDQRDAHKSESEKFQEALNSNTRAITELVTWMKTTLRGNSNA